jgi:3-phosphoshikimate 1-carboxyvinyltransferase
MVPDALLASASDRLRGSVAMPGDKSLSHRAVILAAMAEGRSSIGGLSDGDDVRRTIEAVRALGAGVEEQGGRLLIAGAPWHSPAAPIDCGNSGTTARLLMGAVAGRPIAATFTGDESLRRRPMGRVTEPLARMGARICGGDRLPVEIAGCAPAPISFVNGSASAQVKSALLLAGLGGSAAVEIVEPRQSRDHSERMLGAFGVAISTTEEPRGTVISLGEERRLRATCIDISGDPSSAAFPLVAALLTRGSEVTVPGLLVNPLRTGLYDTLAQMGADLRSGGERLIGGEPVADVTAASSVLRGVTVAADRAPRMIDEYPILAVAAARAEGETVMHGLGELRVKESDRLAALADGLTACGVRARAEGDALRVEGGPVRGGVAIDSRGDHRIAMAFLVLGLVSEEPIRVRGAQMIATSFPGFAATMRALGARIEPA